MAQKRMFDKRVVSSDRFIDLPHSSKALYFMAGMEADDKGFFQPRKIQRMCGFTDDDFKILISKGYFITFDSGVMVVTDWNKNNWLDSRRLVETDYIDELNMLKLINDRYEYQSEKEMAKQMLSQNSIEENSIVENNNIYSREDDNKNTINLIINYLNDKAMTSYKSTTQSTIKHIKARLNEGFKFDDFVTVIDIKTNEWKNTDMEKYLRPETLFGTKFESYLNQKEKSKPKWFDKKIERTEVSKDEEDKLNQMLDKYK